MAARTGMLTLLDLMRGLTNAGTADYTAGTVTYWTNQQLQDRMDSFRLDITRETMFAVPDLIATGTTQYTRYTFQFPNVEELTGGTTFDWMIQDTSGSIIGTVDYTVDYNSRIVTFGSDTSGSVRLLSYRSYDLNRAAAAIWRDKASSVANRFNVKADDHTLSLDQLFKHYMKMASEFDKKAGGSIRTMRRFDAVPNFDTSRTLNST